MLLIVDHRDSFTWNLVHTLTGAGTSVRVIDGEHVTAEAVRALSPRGLVFSPGPGHPSEARASLALLERLAGELPILGVCLGHQLICTAWGARVVHAPHVFHGRTSWVRHDGSALFSGLPSPFRAARYHSLAVDAGSLPAELEATAFAVAHAGRPTVNVTLVDAGPAAVGAALLTFEVMVAIWAQLLGINAFDQPAVAFGKKAALARLLGEPADLVRQMDAARNRPRRLAR